MRFKSGRFWSGKGSSARIAFFCAAFAFAPGVSFATVTLTIQPGGPQGNIGTTNAYFPAGNAPTFNVPTQTVTAGVGTLIPGATAIDFGKYQYISGNYPIVNASWYPTNNPTSATGFMLVVMMQGTISGVVGYGETIATLPGTSCADPQGCVISSAGERGPIQSSGGTSSTVSNYYYDAYVISPGSTIPLYLDFRTMCDAFTFLNAGAGPCTSSLLYNPVTGAANYTQMFLNFEIYPIPVGVTQEPVWNSTLQAVDQTNVMTFNFANAPATGTFSCNLPSAYYPGDGQIIVNGQQFGYTGTTSPPDGLDNVIVLATKGTLGAPPPNLATQLEPNAAAYVAGADPSLGTYAINSGPIALNPGEAVGPFVNSTASDPIYYALGFIGEDDYQFIVQGADGSGPVGGAESCSYSTVVQTASIETFLSASKCFIATATFRSMDSPPLVLLRAFRDRFLEHFGLGRGFVHWYYGWSPPAADWLVANPVYRFPIFLALIPLQILAWLVLHPFELVILFMMALSLLSYGLSFRLRDRERHGRHGRHGRNEGELHG